VILHIFKKDCRLLWLWILAVAVINLTSAAFWAAASVVEFRGEGIENPYIVTAWLQSIITWLAAAGLISAAVQQDSLADPAPDCWTRPVSRRDLLLAKLLFALVAVQGPIFLGDLVQGLVLGFPVAAAAGAAAVRWLTMACSLSLFVIAVAAVGRTLTTSMVIVLFWYFTTLLAWQLINPMTSMWRGYSTGLDWTTQAIGTVLLISGTGLTLSLQYRTRRLWAARASLAATLLLLALVPLLPFSARAEIQTWFASRSQATRSITLTPVRATTSLEATHLFDRTMYGQLMHVLLPLQISGLPAGAMLVFDDARIRLLDARGKSFFDRNMGRPLHVRAQGGAVQFEYPLTLPRSLYERIAKQPLRIEVTYMLTVAEENAAYTITAVSKTRRLKDVGWCKTQITQSASRGPPRLEMNCLNASRPPVCMTTGSSQYQAAERTECKPNYAPLPSGVMPGILHDSLAIKRGDVPKQAPPETAMTLKTYRVVDHFVRKVELDVTEIRERRPIPIG